MVIHNPPFLNSQRRSEALHLLGSTSYDVLIIGGGITGVGIALDCASRGLKTALVEMQDYGAGTSSRSTKLIHGGLRYLKQFEFALVAEVGKERAILHRNAPHLVKPEGMLLPIVKGGTFGRLGVSFGLWFYDLLAQVQSDERRVMLNRASTLKEEPLLKAEGLKGAGLYSEYRTDDARLVMAVLKTAVQQGAHALNYIKATELLYEAGRVRGAKVEDVATGEVIEINALEVVNAAGPWVDAVRRLDGSVSGKRLHHTKGVHLTVPHAKLPLKHSVYYDIPSDGRMMFAVPRGKFTYLGTTDTNYTTDPKTPYCTAEDAKYLLDATNHLFPSAELSKTDVISTWAGIRPLIHEEGKSPSELSRKDEIFLAPSRLITIAGGKLTGFRKMAQRVTDLVMQRLIDADVVTVRQECKTQNIVLEGGDFPAGESARVVKDLALRFQAPEELVREYMDLFGTSTRFILESANALDTDSVLESALRYAVTHESVQNPGDFLIRRTGMLYFDRNRIERVRSMVEAVLSETLGEKAAHSPELDREYEAVVAFKKAETVVSEPAQATKAAF